MSAPIIVFCSWQAGNCKFPLTNGKKTQTTLKSKLAYLVDKLANVIWGENWDAKYFLDNSTKMSFGQGDPRHI